jgi:hypothetical protein
MSFNVVPVLVGFKGLINNPKVLYSLVRLFETVRAFISLYHMNMSCPCFSDCEMFERLEPVLRKQAVGRGHVLIQRETHICLQAVQEVKSACPESIIRMSD